MCLKYRNLGRNITCPHVRKRILYLFFSQKVNKQHSAGYLYLIGYVAKHTGNLDCNENPPSLIPWSEKFYSKTEILGLYPTFPDQIVEYKIQVIEGCNASLKKILDYNI